MPFVRAEYEPARVTIDVVSELTKQLGAASTVKVYAFDVPKVGCAH